MSPYEESIVLPTLRALSHALGGTVTSLELAETLHRPRRTAQYYLKRLEKVGVVNRPNGHRGGWVAVQR